MTEEKGIDINNPEVLLVAGALLKPALAAEVAQQVEPDDFEDPRLSKIWAAIVGMLDEGYKESDIDPVGVGKRFSDNKESQMKVALFCDKLIDEMPRVSSLAMSAHRVRRRATMRIALSKMREIATELKTQIDASDGEMSDLDERLAMLSVAVTSRSDKAKKRVTMADMAGQVEEYFDRLYSGDSSQYIATGIPRLDDFLGGGLRPGQLHVVLGGTGSGKTAFSSQVCDHAVAHGRRAMMFSMEVDPLDVFIRDTERKAGVSRWDLRTHQRDEAIAKLSAALGEASGKSGKIVYGQPISVEGIRQAILTEQLRTGKVDLVVVDHAQVAVMTKSEIKSTPRYLQVKSTAEGLQRIARALNVAMVLTAQMNPPAKGDAPNMYMVRESKDIIHPAEVVMTIYHEKAEGIGGEVLIAKSFISLEKCRAGREGKIEIRYNGKLFRFEEPYHGPEEDA